MNRRAAAVGCIFLASSLVTACSARDPGPTGPNPPTIQPDGSSDALDGGRLDRSDAPDDGAAQQDAMDAFASDACRPPSAGDLPCEVAQVLEICQNCHRDPPQRGAPFPFLTYEDTQAVYFGAMLRWQRMAQVIEPNDPLHMPPRTATDVPQPTDEQLQTLRAWFASCTPPVPEHDGCDKGEAP